jgi:amino acid transporter
MGKKELVVKSLVWWIVATGLSFCVVSLIANATGIQKFLKPEGALLIIGVLVTWVIYVSDKWRDWLRE